jgi:hypothetical protein
MRTSQWLGIPALAESVLSPKHRIRAFWPGPLKNVHPFPPKYNASFPMLAPGQMVAGSHTFKWSNSC